MSTRDDYIKTTEERRLRHQEILQRHCCICDDCRPIKGKGESRVKFVEAHLYFHYVRLCNVHLLIACE